MRNTDHHEIAHFVGQLILAKNVLDRSLALEGAQGRNRIKGQCYRDQKATNGNGASVAIACCTFEQCREGIVHVTADQHSVHEKDPVKRHKTLQLPVHVGCACTAKFVDSQKSDHCFEGLDGDSDMVDIDSLPPHPLCLKNVDYSLA